MFHYSNSSRLKKRVVYAFLILTIPLIAACSSRQEQAESYYKSGTKYLDKHQYGKARVQLKNALQLDHNMLPAWRALSKIENHEKHWGAWGGTLKKIVELDPKDVKSRVSLAKLYLVGGNIDKALKQINAAAKLEPKSASVLALRAGVLFRLKDTKGAAREAHKALEIEPGNADASVVLAADDLARGDAQAALKALQAIKSAHADDLGVIASKLRVYEQLKEPDKVEAILKRLVRLHPRQAAFRALLIRFYLAHKRPQDAENELKAIVAKNPKDVTAELQLVNVINTVKGADAARAELNARIKKGGRVFPYQIALAKLDFAQKKPADAVKILEGLIKGSTSENDVLGAKVTLASMYMQQNDIAKAEPLVSQILSVDKRNTAGLLLRASIRLRRGQTDDAIADLREALNDQPRSPQLLTSLAVAYERSGSIGLANDAYLKALRESGYQWRLGLQYVAFLRRRGLNDQVESILTKLADHNPGNLAVLSALAKVKIAHHDWAGAHAIADRIRKLGTKPGLIVADQIQGAAFSGQNKFEESLAALRGVYDALPGAVQPMAVIVGTYMRAHKADRAEAFLRSVLQANPHNDEALVLLGGIRASEGKLKEAANYFKSAIKQQPKAVPGYSALANLYTSERKLDAAVGAVQAGLKEQPKSFILRMNLAGLYEAQHKYNTAISVYEGLLKDQPGSIVVANNLASLLADHRTDKASLDQAKSLSELLEQSNVPQFEDTLGWVTYRTGDYTKAVKLLEAAAGKLPKVGLIRYHLGMADLASGQQKKGLKELKRARQLAGNDKALKARIDAAIKEHPIKNDNKQTREKASQPG